MYKVFGFLKKREDLSREAFVKHYEEQHVPLILSLAPRPLAYRRRYLNLAEEITGSGNHVGFDVMTELEFEHAEAFNKWSAAIFAPGSAEQVIADEERFLDRSRTCAYVVDERTTV